MTLSDYFSRDGSMNLTRLADKIGVTKGRLSQLRDSQEWPPEIALRVEEATEGTLDAAKLSPIVARAREAKAA